MKLRYWCLLGLLYFLQGFPAGLLVHALPPILRSQGAPLEAIGFIKLLALPWVLKFLWAPYVERYYVTSAGKHRFWILLMQVLTVFALTLMVFVDLSSLGVWNISLLFLLVFLLNTFCATQDIATDGLAVKMLPAPLRGLGNSVQVSGYKVGLLFGGAAILFGMDQIGWAPTLWLMAVLVAVCLLPVFLFKEISVSANVPVAAAIPEPNPAPKSHGLQWILHQLISFTRRPGMTYWLVVMCLYKVGDSLGSAMIKPLLVDSGVSLTQLAELTVIANLCGVVAAFVSGAIYLRLGPKFCLLAFGLMQGLSLGAYALIDGQSGWMFIMTVSITEQVADAMATVALFALMMAHCRAGSEGADYTLQACLQVMIAGVGSLVSGTIARLLGFEFLFLLAMGVTWVCLIPLYRLFVKDQFAKLADKPFHPTSETA